MNNLTNWIESTGRLIEASLEVTGKWCWWDVFPGSRRWLLLAAVCYSDYSHRHNDAFNYLRHVENQTGTKAAVHYKFKPPKSDLSSLKAEKEEWKFSQDSNFMHSGAVVQKKLQRLDYCGRFFLVYLIELERWKLIKSLSSAYMWWRKCDIKVSLPRELRRNGEFPASNTKPNQHRGCPEVEVWQDFGSEKTSKT